MLKDLLKQEWLLDVFKCGQYGIFINSFRLRVMELKDYCILHLAIQPKGKLPSEKIVLV